MSTVSTTWDWFSSVPLAHSAGTTISGWYEGAKNRCVLNYALSTVEATVKVAASAAHPVVQRFDSKSEFCLFLRSACVLINQKSLGGVQLAIQCESCTSRLLLFPLCVSRCGGHVRSGEAEGTGRKVPLHQEADRGCT